MKGKNFIGIIVILIGAGLFIDSLGYYNFSHLISQWWPLLIIAFGISHISKNNNSIFFGVIVILIGLLLQSEKLSYFNFDFWDVFFPLVLIIFGVSILLPTRKRFKAGKHFEKHNGSDINVIFGGQNKVIQDKEFKSLSASVIFGALELDLLDCDFAGNEAYLDLDCVFGGIEIVIPRNFKINVTGSPVFGGFEDKTRQSPDDNSKILHVNYSVIFGGIEIKN